jgi:HK97 family phage major capsid protein/HK97 family phage prohead protease
MTDVLKLPIQFRFLPAADIERVKEGESPPRYRFPASSETPVERYYGDEVLSHEPGAVRLERALGGAMPLLFNHDWSDPIGMIETAAVKDRRLIVDARLFDTARAREVGAMMDQGLRNVSIGYRLHTVEENTKTGTFTARDWEPFECSIVTVPADSSVGLGREAEREAIEVRVINVEKAPSARSVTTMVETTSAAAGAIAEGPANVLDFEARRKQAIVNLAKANKLDERYVRHWIESGASLDTVATELLSVMEERSKLAPVSESAIGLAPADVRKYSLVRALRAAVAKDWRNAGLELEAHKAIMGRTGKSPQHENSFFVPFEVQRRDLTAASAGAGGYLVETANVSFIELLRNQSVAFRMGATRLAGLVGNVTIPKQTGAATAYWLANESTQITEGNQTFGQLSLTPKNVAALTEISHQLLSQSDPSVEALVTGDLAKVVGLAVDVAALRGSGASGEPLGIVNTGGIGSVSGTTLGAAGIIEFQSDVAANNALAPGFGYVTTPAVAGLLMIRPELPTTGTTRLWRGNLLQGTMFDLPAMTSQQMAAATMLGGHWPSLIVAEWGTLELMVNPFSDFTRGLVGIRAWYTCDVGLRYAGAFSYASTIT